MYETILVPTDGSEHAERAAEHAVSLARAFDAGIHVIAVVDVESTGGPFSAGGVDDEYVSRMEERAAETIGTVEDVVADNGIDPAETAVLRGKATKSILEYASEHDVDVVAMGTHGRTGIEHYVTGSVTEHVVRFAEVPVLTTRATDRSRVTDGYDEILVPTDGSEYAAEAFDHGIAVAEAYGARIHAVNVVNVTDLAPGADPTPSGNVLEGFESAGEAATEAVATQARSAGLEAVTAVRHGTPARGLLEYADERDVDLIAMGTAGKTGPSRYLLGSTTERIIRHADQPVLAVNARERGD